MSTKAKKFEGRFKVGDWVKRKDNDEKGVVTKLHPELDELIVSQNEQRRFKGPQRKVDVRFEERKDTVVCPEDLLDLDMRGGGQKN